MTIIKKSNLRNEIMTLRIILDGEFLNEYVSMTNGKPAISTSSFSKEV